MSEIELFIDLKDFYNRKRRGELPSTLLFLSIFFAVFAVYMFLFRYGNQNDTKPNRMVVCQFEIRSKSSCKVPHSRTLPPLCERETEALWSDKFLLVARVNSGADAGNSAQIEFSEKFSLPVNKNYQFLKIRELISCFPVLRNSVTMSRRGHNEKNEYSSVDVSDVSFSYFI